MSEHKRSTDFFRWIAAIAAGVVAMVLRGLLDGVIGANTLAYVFAYPAVAAAAVLVGAGPALGTMAAATFWVLTPGLSPHAWATWTQTLIFVPVATLVAVVLARYSDAFTGTETVSDSLAESATIRALRLTIWAALLLPSLLFAVAAAFSYQSAFEQAAERASRSVRAVEEYILRAVEINESALARALDMVGDQSAAEIRSDEFQIHRRLAWISQASSQIEHLAIWGVDGRILAHSDQYPANPDATIGDPGSFEWLRARPHEILIGWSDAGLRAPLVNALTLGRARLLRDGRFAGIATAAVYPDALTDFYSTLARPDEGVGFSLVRADGRTLASWPRPASPASHIDESSALYAPISAGAVSGVLDLAATATSGRQLVTFQRIGSHRLYATCNVDHASVVSGWYRRVGILAAFTFPTAFGLMIVAWIALVRTRRELAAVAGLKAEAEQRMQVETALREVQKLEALGRLTGGVAHDVNNVLMVISNSLQILKRLKPELRRHPQVAAIERSVSAGGNLTQRLLSFSRRQPLSLEVLDLTAREEVLGQLVHATTGRGIRVEFRVAPDVRSIRADPSELELAVINLAANARDAMPQGGRIGVRIRNARAGECPGIDGPMVMIAFSDTGHGIARHHLARVFEPFYTTKAVGKGTGLGLSQIYGFCAQSGGRATIASVVGVGTRVRMFLPAAEVQVAELQQDRRVRALRGLRVLLIEENAAAAANTRSLLESFGSKVEHVTSVAEGEALLAGEPERFDAILSDLIIAGRLTSLGFASRALAQYPGMGIVLMSGQAGRIRRDARLPVTVLQKPLKPETLVHALRVAIARLATETGPGTIPGV